MKMQSPKVLLAASLLVLGVTAGASASSGASGPRVVGDPPLTVCLKQVKSKVHTHGKLTVATNDPALPPWFVNNKPGNQRGYESAVAYHLAATLGFKAAQVTWYNEPYELSESAGRKPFDFDINEITYNAKLTTKVSFSVSYFNVNQSLVAMRGTPIVTRHTPSELKTYLYGDVAASPGLSFIRGEIKPSRAPIVYGTLAEAISALSAGKIDAIVVDTPSGQYIASEQLTGGDQVAQFHTTNEHYVLLLQKASGLTACVNTAIRTLAQEGELGALSKKYLGIYNSIPVIKP